MPLAFTSKSHGSIAFGFFNIETDMLLLEQLFFFADRFCEAVVELAKAGQGEVELQGWRIDDRGAIGNLHGAIAGLDLSGFIGATYREWPFPALADSGSSRPFGALRMSRNFKQSPDGSRNQAQVEELIEPFGRPLQIRIAWDKQTDMVSVEEVVFAVVDFVQLVGYVERGGYPRWRDEIRPPYVGRMMERLAELGSPLLPARR